MSQPALLAQCLAGVLCCSILALHLLWVATVHRRNRPVVVSGELDFAATLCGLIGFLIVGLSIIASAGEVWFASLEMNTLQESWSNVVRQSAVRLLALGLSCAVFAVTASAGFWRRRDSLEIHNIETSVVPRVIDSAAAEVGLEGTDAIFCIIRPAAGHATVFVRGLDRAATAELLTVLAGRLEASPTPPGSSGNRYTAAAAGLLVVTFIFFFAYFIKARTF